MKVFDHDSALAACEPADNVDGLDALYADGELVINAYLIRGMYKIARQKHEHGELNSAKNIYQFLSSQYERSPFLKCAEIGMSTAALAQIAAAQHKYLEAEQLYIKALSVCIDHLGDSHAVTLTTFKNYGELLREMRLPEEAVVVEMRAQDKCKDKDLDINTEDSDDRHHFPLAS